MQTRRPAWGLLYGTVLFMLALMLLADWVAPTLGWSRALDVMVVLVMYGLMALWLRANRGASLRPELDTDTSGAKEEQVGHECRSPLGEFRHVSPR